MHVFPYEMKRAHWRLTGWMYQALAETAVEMHERRLLDITPARYDIMHVIRQRPSWMVCSDDFPWEASFRVIVDKLGLHPSTISKCLKALVRVGFLTRHLMDHDRRQSYFRMTWLGRNLFDLAQQAVTGEIDDPFLEANTWFARTAAWDRKRLVRSVGECAEDNMLIGFGKRARCCARELGSHAWPVYDPDFDDPQLAWKYAGMTLDADRARGGLPPYEAYKAAS